MRRVPAIILAGGLSTRMGGGNKALRMLGGETLLTHVIRRLRPQCDRLAINANGEADQFDDYRLPVVPDDFAGFAGPLAGVLAGMGWAAGEGAASVVSVSVDTPFIPHDLLHRLAEARGRSGLAVAAILFNKANVLFLQRLAGSEAVAQYSATWQLVDAIPILVSNLLLALGMQMVSPMTLSLPLKLLLFVLVSGWTRLLDSLFLSYL